MTKLTNKTKFIAHTAIIAALYAVLTLVLAPFSYGTVQVRVSELLTLLPALTPAAIPGVFVGCLIANIYTGSVIDIIFGSLTTLAAAYCTYKLRGKKWLMPIPPILLNALVVGYYLTLQFGGITVMNMLSVGAGQIVACYILPIYFILEFENIKARVGKFFRY